VTEIRKVNWTNRAWSWSHDCLASDCDPGQITPC